MKGFLLITGSILIFFSIIFNLVFFGLWNQEKSKNINLNLQVHQLESKINVSNSNTPSKLSTIAKEFGETLFTFNKDNQPERKRQIEASISPSLSKVMFDPKRQGEPANADPVGSANPELSSVGKIKDAVYNWTGNDTAKVIVTIEQTLSAGSDSAKTIYKLNVNLKNNGEKWMITDFTMQEIM